MAITRNLDVPVSHVMVWLPERDSRKGRVVTEEDLAKMRYFSATEMYESTARMFVKMGLDIETDEAGPSMLRWLIENVAQYNGATLDCSDWTEGVLEFVEYLRAYVPAGVET